MTGSLRRAALNTEGLIFVVDKDDFFLNLSQNPTYCPALNLGHHM